MSNMGYINYDGIDCVYSEKDGVIELIAKNDKENKDLRACSFKRNYMIEYDNILGKKYYAYINDATAYFNGYMELHTKYIIEAIPNKNISHLQITGEDIDVFFNPAKYFFSFSKEGTEKIGDVVYSKANADHWEINIDGKSIEISLSYGNILRDGVRSDLKLHPILTLSFPPTEDMEWLYRMYGIVVKFLQIVLYKNTHGKFKVELYSTEGGTQSYLVQLFDYADMPLNPEKEFREINYNNYNEYLGRLWQLAADNYGYDLKHFPNMNIRFSGKDYTPLDLFYIFTAFEYECAAEKDIYNSPDETLISSIKESVLKALTESCECQCTTDEEKDFLKNTKDSICKQGKEYGQRKKVTNAYKVLSKAFEDSLENILYLHRFENKKILSRKEINKIADFLTTTRGKIAHGSMVNKFSDEEVQFIRFFEILTYSMLLKRAGLTESEIEMIIGAVFYCNYKMICK